MRRLKRFELLSTGLFVLLRQKRIPTSLQTLQTVLKNSGAVWCLSEYRQPVWNMWKSSTWLKKTPESRWISDSIAKDPWNGWNIAEPMIEFRNEWIKPVMMMMIIIMIIITSNAHWQEEFWIVASSLPQQGSDEESRIEFTGWIDVIKCNAASSKQKMARTWEATSNAWFCF